MSLVQEKRRSFCTASSFKPLFLAALFAFSKASARLRIFPTCNNSEDTLFSLSLAPSELSHTNFGRPDTVTMRLLDVGQFPPPPPDDDPSTPIGEYAILSHTWRNGEIILHDLRHPQEADTKAGWAKLRGAQDQARLDGYNKIWIDTCCIDKTNNAELGETINSMYRYYRESAICYVYLDDFSQDSSVATEGASTRSDEANHSLRKGLAQCRWFKRGWTLQELIAPELVRFYDRNWTFLGTLQQLAGIVSQITRIHKSMLQHEHEPSFFSIAQRMSWAAGRETTRPEDRAYSLFGILDINLDIRYGEGSSAFTRLQREIVAHSSDQSIFAWEIRLPKEQMHVSGRFPLGWPNRYPEWFDLLAPSPDAFRSAGDIVALTSDSFQMTNTGLRITATTVPKSKDNVPRDFPLACALTSDFNRLPFLRLAGNAGTESYWVQPSANETHYSRLGMISSAEHLQSYKRRKASIISIKSSLKSNYLEREKLSRTIRLHLQLSSLPGMVGRTGRRPLRLYHISGAPCLPEQRWSSTGHVMVAMFDEVELECDSNSQCCSTICLKQDQFIVIIRMFLRVHESVSGSLSVEIKRAESTGNALHSVDDSDTMQSFQQFNDTYFDNMSDSLRPLPVTKLQDMGSMRGIGIKLDRVGIAGLGSYSLSIRSAPMFSFATFPMAFTI